MTQEEKLEEAKRLYKIANADQKYVLESLFPELAESEGDRISKELIYFISGNTFQFGEDIDKYKSWVAWLEKQGKQKVANNVGRFKVGDWVVFNNKHQSIYQVKKIEDGYYILRHTHGGTFRVCVLHDESLRLWTIQDAKDGDVLACNEEILLFKSYSVQGRISLYCWYNGQKNHFFSKEVTDTLLTTRNKIHPATKEQRELLFQKMKEAGYEWDANKLELKKIDMQELVKQTPAWSEENEYTLGETIQHLEELIRIEKVKHCGIDVQYYQRDIDWLKSIKDRYTWKPSDEHYELEEFAKIVRGNLTGISEAVQELFEAKYLQLTGNRMYGGFKD